MSVAIRNNTIEFDADSTVNSIGDVGVDIDTGRMLNHNGTTQQTVAWLSDVPTLAVYSAQATVSNGSTTSVSHGSTVSIGVPFALSRADSIDSDVVLLLHCDGSNGSTTVTDETGKTVTVYGDTHIDTGHSVFGGASLHLDGSGDYATVPDNSSFPDLTDTFTIEFRIRTSTTSGDAHVMNHAAGSSESYAWAFRREGAVMKFYASSNGSAWDISNGDSCGTIAANVWSHIAVTRSGNTWSMYCDGVRGSTFTSSASLLNVAGPLTIGRPTSVAVEYYSGHLDEILIRNGVASYTGSTYTVPTSQTSGSTTTYTALTIGTSGAINAATTSASTVFTNNTGATVTALFGVIKLA